MALKFIIKSYEKKAQKYGMKMSEDIMKGYKNYEKAYNKMVERTKLRAKYIEATEIVMKKFVKLVKTEIIPYLDDPLPVMDFVHLISRKADIKITHMLIIEGLDRLTAADFYGRGMTRDDMMRVRHQLIQVKKSMRAIYAKPQ